ncbi:hypothetical protein [Bythopirellula polymerisocia]|uniref:hypothetical protein n=1 Tax=Bythopirellula polymerisocia TaxID=2528003 RepID=UPI0018D37415|nr:hypothetical protein [Bythopirellula polymerisocia]
MYGKTLEAKFFPSFAVNTLPSAFETGLLFVPHSILLPRKDSDSHPEFSFRGELLLGDARDRQRHLDQVNLPEAKEHVGPESEIGFPSG